MKATMSKGVYNLNPTSAVMKLGGEQQREANKPGPVNAGNKTSMPEAHETRADTANLGSAMSSKKAFGEGHTSDFYGVESEVHHKAHPAMQTRIGHARNRPHSDGRRHENDHHAVKMAKGKM